MPFEVHPVFQKPTSGDCLLWRYMDFPKFVSMLEKRALYFCNLEVLSRTDPFEGCLPINYFEHRKWATLSDVPLDERQRFTHSGSLSPDQELQVIKSAREHYARVVWHNRKSIYVNCWHMNIYESPAMWAIYAVKGNGIAVKSTLRALESAIFFDGRALYAGQISYTDYETDPEGRSPSNLFVNAMRKRQSFNFETELRLVFWDNDVSHKTLPDGSRINRDFEEIEKMTAQPGIEIGCNLELLIQGVFVHPGSETWFRDLVTSILRKYGLEKKGVMPSALDAHPIR